MTPTDARRQRSRFFANYFFQFATLGVFLPFFGLFMQQKGFSGKEIGLIIMTVPLMQTLANPVTGYLADTLMSRQRIYRTALVGVLCLVPGFYLAETFWQFIAFVAMYGFFRLPKVAILNAAAFEQMEAMDADYGRLRLGGSVGFILFVAMAGWWTDQFGVARMPDLLIVGLIGHLLVGWRAPVDLVASAPSPAPGAWRHFFRDAGWLVFLAGLLFSRMAEGGYNIFYSVHLVDLGFSPSFAGAMWALAVSSEVVFLLLSERIIARWSLEAIMLGTYTVAAARWWLTVVATTAWQFAALQLVHGITFGLFYVAAVAWAHRHAPAGLATSAQGVVNAVMFGVAGVGGMLLSGPLYDWAGGQGVFQMAGALALLSVVVALLGRRLRPSLAQVPPQP